MNKIYWISLVLMLIIITVGCVDNVAPGCFPSIGGGCFGTHIIKNLTIEPQISCLKIETNNCNGGIIEFFNYCTEPILIEGIKLEKSRIDEKLGVRPSELSIDAERTSSGEIIVNRSQGTFGFYKPSFDDFIVLNGSIGNTSIKISYVKTKSLC